MKLVHVSNGFRKFSFFYVGWYRSDRLKGYHMNNGVDIGYWEIGSYKRFFI